MTGSLCVKWVNGELIGTNGRPIEWAHPRPPRAPQTEGRKSATTDWAHFVGSSSVLVTTVLTTLFCCVSLRGSQAEWTAAWCRHISTVSWRNQRSQLQDKLWSLEIVVWDIGRRCDRSNFFYIDCGLAQLCDNDIVVRNLRRVRGRKLCRFNIQTIHTNVFVNASSSAIFRNFNAKLSPPNRPNTDFWWVRWVRMQDVEDVTSRDINPYFHSTSIFTVGLMSTFLARVFSATYRPSDRNSDACAIEKCTNYVNLHDQQDGGGAVAHRVASWGLAIGSRHPGLASQPWRPRHRGVSLNNTFASALSGQRSLSSPTESSMRFGWVITGTVWWQVKSNYLVRHVSVRSVMLRCMQPRAWWRWMCEELFTCFFQF